MLLEITAFHRQIIKNIQSLMPRVAFMDENHVTFFLVAKIILERIWGMRPENVSVKFHHFFPFLEGTTKTMAFINHLTQYSEIPL